MSRGQDGVEYSTDQADLGALMHTPYHYAQPRGSGFTLHGNPVIVQSQPDCRPSEWKVTAWVDVYGMSAEYTEYHSKLHHAQDAVRHITLNAERIVQEWDQVLPGRLPQ